MDRASYVCVVGAGVFGAWTAKALVDAGARVTLVDAWGAANARASSSDASRILRCAYADDPLYADMAWRSLARWRELEGEVRDGLITRTGVLWLKQPGDDKVDASERTLAALGIPTERIGPAEIVRRYPAMTNDGVVDALLEPEGSVAKAHRAVQALVATLERRGVELVRARVAPIRGGGALEELATESGERITAERFVVATGPWLGETVPDLLGTRFFPTRQAVLYFGPPAGDARWSPPAMTVWLDGEFYGFPDLEGRGFKIARHAVGEPFDPTAGARVVGEDDVAKARAFLATRFPEIASAPLVEGRVCVYENSADGDLLIDRHPEIENLWLAGCGSGHGFKHGPAVGELAARLVLEGRAVDEPRLSVAAKGDTLLHAAR
jgi:glycine/D-amino acid oxidase-like deaminating enzyme